MSHDIADFLSEHIDNGNDETQLENASNNNSTGTTTQYYARVIMTNDPSIDKPTWISSENQQFPFIMGPETVVLLAGKSPMEIMEFIGYERSFVKHRIDMGYRFYIVFFTGYLDEQSSSSSSSSCDAGISIKEPLAATWSNILSLIMKRCPICGEKCSSVYDKVQSTDYNEFNCGYDIDHIPSEIHQEVSSFESFAVTSLPTTPGLVRSFLRHTMKCTRLFRGDGYCYDELNRRGAKEYLIPRVQISCLVNASEVFHLV